MKIALCCRAYPTHRPGGMPFVCQDRALALALENHEVHVLTTGGGGERRKMDGPVHIHHLDCDPQKYTPAFAQECLQACKKLRVEIVHLDGFDVHRTWWEDGPWKVGITLHGFGPGAFFTKWNLYSHNEGGPPPEFNAPGMVKEIQALRKADRVIAISRHEQWIMEDFYNLYGNVHLVYNPISTYFFDKATDALPDADHFICLGNPGTSGNRRFDLARKTGRNVRIIRGVEREELPTHYMLAKAIIVPTFWSQGYDLTIAEALASRRPVIATATGSYYREGRKSPYVRLVPRGDVNALAEAMQDPLPVVRHDAADRHRMCNHAKRWLEVME